MSYYAKGVETGASIGGFWKQLNPLKEKMELVKSGVECVKIGHNRFYQTGIHGMCPVSSKNVIEHYKELASDYLDMITLGLGFYQLGLAI